MTSLFGSILFASVENYLLQKLTVNEMQLVWLQFADINRLTI